jgi:hypothetical protein
MFCNNCVTLAYLHTKKSCIRCQSDVLNNISVLCERCSGNEGVCSACLKKNSRRANPNSSTKRGCKSCGK